MHSVRIHAVISQLISFLYYAGFWHRGDKPTATEIRMKLFYCIYHSLFFLSLIVGAITSETRGHAIFLVQSSIGIGVLNVKLWLLITKQLQIVDILNRVCIFSIRYDEDLIYLSDKLRGFVKFLVILSIVAFTGCLEVTLIPFLESEKVLVLQIGFPFDYRSSEVAFYIANLLIFSEILLSMVVIFLSAFIWYLLLSLSLRYEVLGSELKKIGSIKGALPVTQRHEVFSQDLKAVIDNYLHIRRISNELESFLGNVFALQLGTSSLSICGSIYCLVFVVSNDLLQILMHLLILYYFLSDIFMITYFGNEITLSGNRLSYSLFESDWTHQPHATKKCLIVFGEFLKQPHQLLIVKLYPLTLETFTMILNSAYSMFNLLKNSHK